MVNKLRTLNPESCGFPSPMWAIRGRSLALAALVLSASTPACATYDAPPEPRIVDLKEGKLSDPTMPLYLTFDEAFKPDTLKVKIAKYAVDAEGLLPDEDTDPMTNLELLFAHDGPGKAVMGTSQILDNNRTLQIVPTSPMPGPNGVAARHEGGQHRQSGKHDNGPD